MYKAGLTPSKVSLARCILTSALTSTNLRGRLRLFMKRERLNRLTYTHYSLYKYIVR